MLDETGSCDLSCGTLRARARAALPRQVRRASRERPSYAFSVQGHTAVHFQAGRIRSETSFRPAQAGAAQLRAPDLRKPTASRGALCHVANPLVVPCSGGCSRARTTRMYTHDLSERRHAAGPMGGLHLTFHRPDRPTSFLLDRPVAALLLVRRAKGKAAIRRWRRAERRTRGAVGPHERGGGGCR